MATTRGGMSLALQAFAFSAASVPPERFLQKGVIHAFGREPFRVDILSDPSGIEFEACYAQRVEAELDGQRIPFISLAHLRLNKSAAGRTQDRADLENLPTETPGEK